MYIPNISPKEFVAKKLFLKMLKIVQLGKKIILPLRAILRENNF